MVSKWKTAETEALQNVVERLGGVIEATESFTTPLSQSIRRLYLRKVAVIPVEFPRPVGVPAQ